MKKVFVFLLALCFLLPAFALADDPITGLWYTYFGDTATAQTQNFHIFYFTDDGKITASQYDLTSEGITTSNDYNVIGIWTNDGGKYLVNIGLLGAEEVTVSDGFLFLPTPESVKIRLRKMDLFNAVKDLKQ